MNIKKIKFLSKVFAVFGVAVVTVSTAESLPQPSLMAELLKPLNPMDVRKNITTSVFGKPAVLAAQRNTLYARLMNWLKRDNKK